MILVTGATGLLGSHLLVELSRGTEEVLALRRPQSRLEDVRQIFSYYEGGPERFERIRWENCSLDDYPAMEELVAGADSICHCAARISFDPKDAADMIRFNVEATAGVVNACLAAGGKRLLHVSSSSAIGHPPRGEASREDMIYAKRKGASAYGESKFQSEMEVWRGMEEGLDAVIVNPVIILGPGSWRRGSSTMMSRVAGGLKYGTPGMTGYVGVKDVVRAMVQLLHSDISGERFILSAGDYRYLEIFEMMADALGQPRKMKTPSQATLRNLARLDGIRGLFTGRRNLTPEQAASAFRETRYSTEKIRAALDFSFTPIEEVIREMALHYLADHG